jgi:hypothetical protein
VRKLCPKLRWQNNWLLHHNNAPFFTGEFLTKYNMIFFPNPHCLPDLAPCDFSLFSAILTQLRWSRQNSRKCWTPSQNITSRIINQPTLWTWAQLERPQVVQPLGSVPAFYGSWRFITAFTRASTCPYPARPIQSTPPHPTSPRSILIFYTHQCLDLCHGLFPSGFPTNNLYVLLFSPICATCSAWSL